MLHRHCIEDCSKVGEKQNAAAQSVNRTYLQNGAGSIPDDHALPFSWVGVTKI